MPARCELVKNVSTWHQGRTTALSVFQQLVEKQSSDLLPACFCQLYLKKHQERRNFVCLEVTRNSHMNRGSPTVWQGAKLHSTRSTLGATPSLRDAPLLNLVSHCILELCYWKFELCYWKEPQLRFSCPGAVSWSCCRGPVRRNCYRGLTISKGSLKPHMAQSANLSHRTET
jgi:hypothetical protein